MVIKKKQAAAKKNRSGKSGKSGGGDYYKKLKEAKERLEKENEELRKELDWRSRRSEGEGAGGAKDQLEQEELAEERIKEELQNTKNKLEETEEELQDFKNLVYQQRQDSIDEVASHCPDLAPGEEFWVRVDNGILYSQACSHSSKYIILCGQNLCNNTYCQGAVPCNNTYCQGAVLV